MCPINRTYSCDAPCQVDIFCGHLLCSMGIANLHRGLSRFELYALIVVKINSPQTIASAYNDLGTTDPRLLPEWDFDKNIEWTPSNVSRNSMKVVWWKCKAGHSYRAKITDRTIEQKGCPKCEAEFLQAFPQMLIMMYAAQNDVAVKTNSDLELGIHLAAYLPELHCAVDIAGKTVGEKRAKRKGSHLPMQSIGLPAYKSDCRHYADCVGNQNTIRP